MIFAAIVAERIKKLPAVNVEGKVFIKEVGPKSSFRFLENMSF